MTSSLHKWESDPLFAAAEVVQDSADRMESIFRLLLHDQTLVQEEHSNPRLLASIEYYKRDLATIFETAKWQLEDFERAVNLSAMQDKACSREDVIFRHRQFIRAIKEQVNHVKKFVDSPSMRDSMRNTKWVDLNKQDRDGLALFLIGGNATDNSINYDVEDSSTLNRFLDSSSSSGLNDDKIAEHAKGEFKEFKMNRKFHSESSSSNEDHLRFGADLKVASRDEHSGGNWDLEANETEPKNVFHENRTNGLYSRIRFFGLWSNLWMICGSKVSKSYIKRFKDGEEQSHSPKNIDDQGQYMGDTSSSKFSSFEGLWSSFQAPMVCGCLAVRCRKFPCHVAVNRQTFQIVFTVLFGLLLLGILFSKIA